MTDTPRPMKPPHELAALPLDEFLKKLDAVGADIKKRDVIGKLRQGTADYRRQVGKMEHDTEQLLNMMGGQLKEEALAEARRIDRGNQLLDTIGRIDREDDQQDEPTKK